MFTSKDLSIDECYGTRLKVQSRMQVKVVVRNKEADQQGQLERGRGYGRRRIGDYCQTVVVQCGKGWQGKASQPTTQAHADLTGCRLFGVL
jgi:hypothetical protein